ncbi:MAG TPA: thioredoxin family protein [Candidatus Sulfotelmatobacter sp.]|nr:thioredoxin family protein [Candidatus Sulfotelmatobacter sp.]
MVLARPGCEFGRPAADFALPGVDGRVWRLGDVRGPQGTVVMFLANHCPEVKAAMPRVVAALDRLRHQGIGAVAVMPNDTAAYPEDSLDNMTRFAAEHRFGFPYLWDDGQAIARAYGATVTPEFFGYDRDMRLQYHGRFDDGEPGGAPPRRHDLVEAMQRIAATGEGPREQAPARGCSIKWRPA